MPKASSDFFKTFALGALSLLSAPSMIQGQESDRGTPPTATDEKDSAEKQLTAQEYDSAARAIVEHATELGLTARVSHPPNRREGEWINPIFFLGQIHHVDRAVFLPEYEKYSRQLVQLVETATKHNIDKIFLEGAVLRQGQSNEDFWKTNEITADWDPTRLLFEKYRNSDSPRFLGAEDPRAVGAIREALGDYNHLGRKGAFSSYDLLLEHSASSPVSVAVNSQGGVTRVIFGDGTDRLALSGEKYQTLKSFIKTLGDILSSDRASAENLQSSEARERFIMGLPSGSVVVFGATHGINILNENSERSIIVILPPEETINLEEPMRGLRKAEKVLNEIEVEVMRATVVRAREQLAHLKAYLGGSLGLDDFYGEGAFANYVQLINDSVLAEIKPELEEIVKSEKTSLSYLTFFITELSKCYKERGEIPSSEVIKALEQRAKNSEDGDAKKLERMITRLQAEAEK